MIIKDKENKLIKYNIKLIHILNNINGYREKKSIDSLSKLQDIGINYIQQVLPLYKGDLGVIINR